MTEHELTLQELNTIRACLAASMTRCIEEINAGGSVSSMKATLVEYESRLTLLERLRDRRVKLVLL